MVVTSFLILGIEKARLLFTVIGLGALRIVKMGVHRHRHNLTANHFAFRSLLYQKAQILGLTNPY